MTGCLRQERSLSVVIIKKDCIKGNSTRIPWVGIEMVEKNLVWIAMKGGRERDRWKEQGLDITCSKQKHLCEKLVGHVSWKGNFMYL